MAFIIFCCLTNLLYLHKWLPLFKLFLFFPQFFIFNSLFFLFFQPVFFVTLGLLSFSFSFLFFSFSDHLLPCCDLTLLLLLSLLLLFKLLYLFFGQLFFRIVKLGFYLVNSSLALFYLVYFLFISTSTLCTTTSISNPVSNSIILISVDNLRFIYSLLFISLCLLWSVLYEEKVVEDWDEDRTKSDKYYDWHDLIFIFWLL